MSTITWVLSHLVGVSSSPKSNVMIRTAFKTPYSPIHIRAFLKRSFGMGGGEFKGDRRGQHGCPIDEASHSVANPACSICTE